MHTLSNLNQEFQNPKTHIFILLCTEAHETSPLNVIIGLKYHLEREKSFFLQNNCLENKCPLALLVSKYKGDFLHALEKMRWFFIY